MRGRVRGLMGLLTECHGQSADYGKVGGLIVATLVSTYLYYKLSSSMLLRVDSVVAISFFYT